MYVLIPISCILCHCHCHCHCPPKTTGQGAYITQEQDTGMDTVIPTE